MIFLELSSPGQFNLTLGVIAAVLAVSAVVFSLMVSISLIITSNKLANVSAGRVAVSLIHRVNSSSESEHIDLIHYWSGSNL